MSYQLDDDEDAEEIVIQRAGSKNIVFQTIHRTLKIRLDIDNAGREVQTAPKTDLSNYDIVLIDEASMLDDKLMNLIMSLRGKAKVIFCGDDNQLPPVELAPGQEISSVFGLGLRTIRLTDYIRQSKDSDIVSVGVYVALQNRKGKPINKQMMIKLRDTLGESGDLIIRTRHITHYIDDIIEEVKGHIEAGFDHRVLAHANKDVEMMNSMIREAIYGHARNMGISLAEARKYVNDAPRREAAPKSRAKKRDKTTTLLEGRPNPLNLHDPQVILAKMSKPHMQTFVGYAFDKPTIANFAICRPNETPPCAHWMTDEGIEYVGKFHGGIGMTRLNELQIEIDTDHDWYMQLFVVSPEPELTKEELEQLILDAFANLPDEYVLEFQARKVWSTYGQSPLRIGIPSWGL